jgi:hypothetical protein
MNLKWRYYLMSRPVGSVPYVLNHRKGSKSLDDITKHALELFHRVRPEMKKAGMEEANIFPVVIIQSLSLQSAIKNIGSIKKTWTSFPVTPSTTSS